MKMRRFLIWTSILVMTANALAQEQEYRLSLAQAQEYALLNNKQLLNLKDDVTNARLRVKESVANGLPQISGSLDYMTYFNYELNFSMGSSEGTEPDINYALLDYGDYQVLSAISQMFASEPITMSDQLSGKLQLSQLIFSGQYLAGIQTAKIARKLADQNYQANALDVKENVSSSYFAILTTEQSLRVLSENLANLDAILQHTQNMYNAGVMEETDVDQVKITVGQVKNVQKSLERMNQLNYNMLKFQLGVAPSTRIVLSDSLTYLLSVLSPPSAIQLDFSPSQNLHYQMMESQVAITKKQWDMKKWAYAPTVAGFYNYTEKFMSTGFDLNPNHMAGISVSVPIFSAGIRKYQLAQSKVSLDIARRNLEMVEDQLNIQKQQLIFSYQNAWENYEIQKENVAVAARVYQSIRNKYQHGLASSLDLTQANSNYLTAESNYLSAVLSLMQAKTALDKLYNKL